MALPVTLTANSKARAAEVMQNFNYLEGQDSTLDTAIGNLRSDMNAADYNLHGQGVVPGYLNDMAPSIQGTTVAINTGMGYVQGARVHYDTVRSVDFTGKAAATYYVLIDSAGVLTAETAEVSTKLTMCSVYWNGSALSNLVDRRSFFPRPSELRKLYGTSANVTAANLNELTGGGDTSLHKHLIPQGSPVNAKAASGTITFTGQPADGETVTIGGTTYTFKTTLSAAYQVKIGATANETADNLRRAINDAGVEGTNYGTGTDPHPTVTATVSTNVVTVTAKVKGAAGNSIALSKTSANITLSGANLSGGVDGTAGTAGELKRDTSYLYVCIGTQTINDDNWRRIALGGVY